MAELIGQFAIVAGINFAAAAFLNVALITPILANFGIVYDNTTTFIASGTTVILNGQLVTMGILMLIELALNIAGINLVAMLNQVSVWWHIGVVAAIVVLMFAIGKPNESGLTYFAIQPLDVGGSWNNNLGFINLQYGPAISYPLILAFFFSLLQANWTYTGYDASAHVAEETVGARMASAWGVFLSVAVSAVVGYVFLVALTLHLPDLSTLFPQTVEVPPQATSSQYYFGGGYAVYDILDYALGSAGRVLSAGIAIAMAFCGLSSVAAAGRMLFAFARDDGVPGSRVLKRVSRRYRTPANALAAIVVIAWLFTVAGVAVGSGVAIVVVTSISTIFLYAAYGVCIFLGATTTEWLEHRVWSLGRLSKPIAWLAIFWVVVLMFLFSWPTSGNIAWPFMAIVFAFLVVYYFAWARSRFKGPQAQGDAAQLTDIEREFEQAAREVTA